MIGRRVAAVKPVTVTVTGCAASTGTSSAPSSAPVELGHRLLLTVGYALYANHDGAHAARSRGTAYRTADRTVSLTAKRRKKRTMMQWTVRAEGRTERSVLAAYGHLHLNSLQAATCDRRPLLAPLRSTVPWEAR